MALKIYYKEDILNAVHSAYVASSGPSALLTELLPDQELQGITLDRLLQVYMSGFNTALVAIGAAFGLGGAILPASPDPAQVGGGRAAYYLEAEEADLLAILRMAIQREMQR